MTGAFHFPKGELLVVNYHGTQRKFIPEFKEQLSRFRKHFRFITPAQVADYYEGKMADSPPSILLTFDDGILNNLFAVEILDQEKIKALFFVIPGFIDTPVESQKEFFLKNIRPNIIPEVDSEKEDFSALSWSQLRTLIQSGHAVGAHTYTHTLCASASSPQNSSFEIINSKQRIEEELRVPVTAYCAPNDSLYSTGKKEMKLIKDHYRFFFSTYPGSNAENPSPWFIKRCNIETHWMQGAVTYAIGRSSYRRWEKQTRLFNQLAESRE